MDQTAAKAFIAAQKAMGPAVKNASNPHLKSKYADLGSVMDAALPALHDHGFALMQPAGQDERGHYVETILLHESGEAFTSRVYLLMSKNDMQALGSAQTYARRYGLLGMAGIAPEDDDGEGTKAPTRQHGQVKPADNPNTMTAPEAQAILSSAPDIPSLTAAWTDLYRKHRAVADDPAVVAAKDARKAALTEAPF